VGKFHDVLLMNLVMSFSRSLRLDVRRPDHLAPLLGFLRDELAEFGGRADQNGTVVRNDFGTCSPADGILAAGSTTGLRQVPLAASGLRYIIRAGWR
jgi:hypothetical protein